MSSKSVIIECNRINSIDVESKGLESTTEQDNASWTNRCNVKLNENDLITLQLSTIHAIGSDANDTMEINGLRNKNGIVDNKLTLRFIPYINDIGYNFVRVPRVGCVKSKPDKDATTTTLELFDEKMYVDNTTAKYGSPLVSAFYYRAMSSDTSESISKPRAPWFLKSAHPTNNDATRFVKIQTGYKGPFKDDTTLIPDSGEDDFYADTFDIPIEIEASYTSPNTICNKINLTLHQTKFNTTDYIASIYGDYAAGAGPSKPMISLESPLFKRYMANGINKVPLTGGIEEGDTQLWQQACFQDIDKWRAVHYSLRMDLVDAKIDTEDVLYPVYLGYCQFITQNDTTVFTTHQYPHYNFTEGTTVTETVSTLPKYFLMATNIAYTEKNLTRFAKFLPQLEKLNKTTGEYFVDFDLGRTKDCMNTTITPNNTSGGGWNVDGLEDIMTFQEMPQLLTPKWLETYGHEISPLTLTLSHTDVVYGGRNYLRIFSRYSEDWKTNARLKNYPYSGNPGSNSSPDALNGDGGYKEASFNDLDDTLSKNAAIGIYPMTLKLDNGTIFTVCALMLQTGTGRRESTGWVFDSETLPLPIFSSGNYAIMSPSSRDNPYGVLWNNQTSNNISSGNAQGDIPYHIQEYINYCYVGGDNITCSWDAQLERASFSNLHCVRKLGVNEVIVEDTGDDSGDTKVIGYNIGQEVVKLNDRGMKTGNITNFTEKTVDPPTGSAYIEVVWEHISYALSDTQSGVYLDSVLFDGKKATADTFEGCLLNKLGFKYSDLMMDEGDLQARHIQGLVSCKPLTTNADIDISSTNSLSIEDGTYDLTATGHSQPDYKLGGVGFQQINLDGSTSTQIIASNLPEKLDTSYYLVYSDICSSDYDQEGRKLNCIGVVPRNYSSGDFVVSFGSNSFDPIQVMGSRHLSTVQTTIRLPTGELAPLNPKSSVIYKIIRKS